MKRRVNEDNDFYVGWHKTNAPELKKWLGSNKRHNFYRKDNGKWYLGRGRDDAYEMEVAPDTVDALRRDKFFANRTNESMREAYEGRGGVIVVLNGSEGGYNPEATLYVGKALDKWLDADYFFTTKREEAKVFSREFWQEELQELLDEYTEGYTIGDFSAYLKIY